MQRDSGDRLRLIPFNIGLQLTGASERQPGVYSAYQYDYEELRIHHQLMR